jgi:phage tail sheath protein FI
MIMPTAPTYPGVYIEEVPSGVRTIVGVGTSTAAFVGFFHRGPTDVALRLFSFADVEREYGGLHRSSAASYGLQQFFLNGGTETYVVRVADGTAVTANAVLVGGGNDIVNVRAGREVLGVSREDPGEWGNALRVEVDHVTAVPPDVLAAGIPETNGELFNLTVSETAVERGRLVVRRTETFRNLTMRPDTPNNAMDVVNSGSKLVQLDRNTLAPLPGNFDGFRPDPTGTVGAALAAPAGVPVVADLSALQVTVNPGDGAADLPAVVATVNYGGATPATHAELRPFLEAAIRQSDPNNPLLAGASVLLEDNRFRVVLGRGGADFNADATVTFAESGGTTAADLGLDAGSATEGPQLVELENGADGNLPTAGLLRGQRAAKTGIYALEDADLFNILCLPRAAALPGADMRAVYAEAEAYCEERRAFLLIDVPEATADLDGAQTWLAANETLRHRNAAVYFPRPRIGDPLNQNRLRSVGASGTIAGLYAATDSARGVWKAPAGTDARLRNVQALDYTLTDRENGVLNPLGVNCLRGFPVFGLVAWGARTLDGADALASEWKYVPVRRLALFLEESLYRGTKWVVFEPNDEPLWSQIRLNIGGFMQNLFRQGAFQGQTPREAYFVKCDAETTTQDDIDRGIVNIHVGFAPLKPAEFVIVRIQQIAGQTEG